MANEWAPASTEYPATPGSTEASSQMQHLADDIKCYDVLVCDKTALKMANEWAPASTEYPATPGSTETSSQMQHLADDMYDKVAAYLQGQIEGSVAEYKLLEDLNNVTSQRYDDMKQVASDETLRPYLQQIDEVDENTRKLEEAAGMLERYVTALGKFFVSL
ncbi:unnamed protein product [Gongylonema pulchrum]|uniref:Biogenesis of lysosome-related organelles complex 1 subunit 2 n=1 Tax=Gongylonema pulchrum TaxID=637853 RepID=A0A183ERD4_9BILA|nr:unnamed protein product [Gongylonema pulchrum]